MPDAQIESNVLKALAAATQLSDENITTTTVYGTVTLSGTVRDESKRVLAETLASKADGVKKVIDELTLSTGDPAPDISAHAQDAPENGTNPTLQSDGTIAPGQPQLPSVEKSSNQDINRGSGPVNAANGASQPNASDAGQPAPYGAPNPRPYGRRPYATPPPPYSRAEEPYGAQQAGQSVIVPSGAMLRVRISQGLDSDHSEPGTTFEGVVLNDVVADDEVAIPRGASVRGTVVDAQTSGALKGRGELSLQLTHVIVGGKTYPIVSDHWYRSGSDKTAQTVRSTVALGAVGALVGAIAGGGAGAAIGAGVGGAAGLGASAASGRSQASIPPEAILTFHLVQQAALTTVSQAEMNRLAYGVPLGAQHLQRRPVAPPQPYYYGPVYYPQPYYPYPY